MTTAEVKTEKAAYLKAFDPTGIIVQFYETDEQMHIPFPKSESGTTRCLAQGFWTILNRGYKEAVTLAAVKDSLANTAAALNDGSWAPTTRTGVKKAVDIPMLISAVNIRFPKLTRGEVQHKLESYSEEDLRTIAKNYAAELGVIRKRSKGVEGDPFAPAPTVKAA